MEFGIIFFFFFVLANELKYARVNSLELNSDIYYARVNSLEFIIFFFFFILFFLLQNDDQACSREGYVWIEKFQETISLPNQSESFLLSGKR